MLAFLTCPLSHTTVASASVPKPIGFSKRPPSSNALLRTGQQELMIHLRSVSDVKSCARRADEDRCKEQYHKLPDTTLVTADRPYRVLRRTHAHAHGVDLGSGKLGVRLGSVAKQRNVLGDSKV